MKDLIQFHKQEDLHYRACGEHARANWHRAIAQALSGVSAHA